MNDIGEFFQIQDGRQNHDFSDFVRKLFVIEHIYYII